MKTIQERLEKSLNESTCYKSGGYCGGICSEFHCFCDDHLIYYSGNNPVEEAEKILHLRDQRVNDYLVKGVYLTELSDLSDGDGLFVDSFGVPPHYKKLKIGDICLTNNKLKIVVISLKFKDSRIKPNFKLVKDDNEKIMRPYEDIELAIKKLQKEADSKNIRGTESIELLQAKFKQKDLLKVQIDLLKWVINK